MENMTTPAVYHHNVSRYNEDKDYERDTIYESKRIASAVIFSVVCVLGVVGNGAVIWATTGSRMKKKTVSAVWYLNLAVADLLTAAWLPLRITSYALNGHWPFGRFMCKIEPLVFVTNMYASIYTLALISVDRCVCVACPVWTRNRRTVRMASRLSLGVWALALALSTPNLVCGDTRRQTSSGGVGGGVVRCYNNYALVADWHNRTSEERRSHAVHRGALDVANFLLGFVVPFSVIVSCYSVVVYRLRNNRSLAGQSARSFKIIASVVAAFFLCWLPYHIVRMIFNVNFPAVETLPLAILVGSPVTFTLALVNGCVNPLLYVFMGQDFKDVFRSRSVLKVLEKAFAEEPASPTDGTPTDADVITLSETEGSTGPEPKT